MPKSRAQMYYEHQEKRAKMKKEIEELQRLTGWNQAEVAEAVGVHESTVFRWLDMGAMPIPIVQGKIRELLDKARENKLAKQSA